MGEAENDNDIPALLAQTSSNYLLMGLDESRRRPLLCDELLRKFPGLRIIAMALNTNIGIFYWSSLEIHSKQMGTNKDALLKVMRDSVLRMKEEQSHERDLIPANG